MQPLTRQELATKVGNGFISDEMESFGDYQAAIEWLTDQHNNV
ncbi:hypothetical protein AB6E04_04840 [Vibrio amylolyticus]